MFNFERFSGAVAAIDDKGNSISYDELAEFSVELEKTAKRKLCFNVCQNSIGSLAGYVCMIEAGVVPVMLAHDLDEALFDNLYNVYEPDYLWIPKAMSEKFHDCEIILERYSYFLLKTKFNSRLSLNNELALLLTTSGSTGSPKFVRQSYKNIRSNTESIVEYLKIDSSERPITLLPMNYTYGISVINTHLYCGAVVLLTDKSLMENGLWNFMKEQKATSIAGVPYIYEMLKKLRFFDMKLPYLKTMTQAGGKLSPELHKEFAKFAAETGRNFVVMYGQAEATARMGYLPPEKSVEKFGSMGIAIPGGVFFLIDADGKEIAESDVVGELVYKGDNVTLGYAECREDLAKGDERGGVLVTGDMAKRDDDGYYYIVGRKKRFLKMFGKRVNLDEIDILVKTHFVGIDSATAGVDDMMYVFVTDNEKLSKVKDYVCQTTKLNPTAVKVKFIENIPRNDSGKAQYSKLEEFYD